MKLSNQISEKVLLSALVIFFIPSPIWTFCFGSNPGFERSPTVRQIKINQVRVSWGNVVMNRNCADNFLVKYWPKDSPNAFQMSDLVPNSMNHTDVVVIPKILYIYQAVAREDKGVVGGIDWNKSPMVEFKTERIHFQDLQGE